MALKLVACELVLNLVTETALPADAFDFEAIVLEAHAREGPLLTDGFASERQNLVVARYGRADAGTFQISCLIIFDVISRQVLLIDRLKRHLVFTALGRLIVGGDHTEIQKQIVTLEVLVILKNINWGRTLLR